MNIRRDLEFLSWIFTWRVYFISYYEKDLEIKYGFEGSISNVDFGLF